MTTTVSRTLALALAVLCVASPAMARDKKPVDPNKKVCRSEVPTGSFMAKSICHTAAEWAQVDSSNAAATDALDRANRSGIAGSGSATR